MTAIKTHRSLLSRLTRWANIRYYRWEIACIRDERETYLNTGLVGPMYLRNSKEWEEAVAAKLRKLEQE
jgi:hypothetical protein